MKVVWWKANHNNGNSHTYGRESKRHAVALFSSPFTYCGCSVPDDCADVVGEASRNITCKKCQKLLKNGVYA